MDEHQSAAALYQRIKAQQRSQPKVQVIDTQRVSRSQFQQQHAIAMASTRRAVGSLQRYAGAGTPTQGHARIAAARTLAERTHAASPKRSYKLNKLRALRKACKSLSHDKKDAMRGELLQCFDFLRIQQALNVFFFMPQLADRAGTARAIQGALEARVVAGRAQGGFETLAPIFSAAIEKAKAVLIRHGFCTEDLPSDLLL